MDEKFTNYYIEILTKTVHDALGKNLVFQAQNRIDTETIQELKNVIEQKETETDNKDQGVQRMQSMIESLSGQVEILTKAVENLNRTVSEKDSIIEELRVSVSNHNELQLLLDEKDITIGKLEDKLEKLKLKKPKKGEIVVDAKEEIDTSLDTF